MAARRFAAEMMKIRTLRGIREECGTRKSEGKTAGEPPALQEAVAGSLLMIRHFASGRLALLEAIADYSAILTSC